MATGTHGHQGTMATRPPPPATRGSVARMLYWPWTPWTHWATMHPLGAIVTMHPLGKITRRVHNPLGKITRWVHCNPLGYA